MSRKKPTVPSRTPSPRDPTRGFRADPWTHLKAMTNARIALGRAGTSLPTAAHLQFQLDHALARDAVHTTFDPQTIGQALQAQEIDTMTVHSQASSRAMYLQRPDLGRALLARDTQRLIDCADQASILGGNETRNQQNTDVAIVIGDGLSALATHRHAAEMTNRLHRGFTRRGLTAAPVVIAHHARVALADEIGSALRVGLIIILLGERPGLSSADSLGAYLTWNPQPGRHDAERNCVSNIRPAGGLSYEAATHKLIYLALEARQRKLSGVGLKDDSAGIPLLA